MNAKKLIALFLSLVMLLSLLPAAALASEYEELPDAPAPESFEELKLVAPDAPDAGAALVLPTEAAPLPDEAAIYTPVAEDGAALPADAETYYDGGDLPDYAYQSQQLIGLEETWVETWDELKAALAAPGAMRIKMQEDVSFKQTSNLSWDQRRYLLEVNGVKSLDLHGYTISATDDEVNYSTMIRINEGAYLELYDTTHFSRISGTHTGRIHYDGYLYYDLPDRERNLFQVDGAFVLNGGLLDVGRVKENHHYLWGFIPIDTYYDQIIGTGVRVSDNGVFIMNGGTVYGRGGGDVPSIRDAAVYFEGYGSRVYINGGTAATFGGADVIYGTGWLKVRNGYFCTSDCCNHAFKGVVHRTHHYGRISIYDHNLDGSVMTEDGLTALVTHATEATADSLELQTLKRGRPTLRVPVPARQYPEQEGLYQYGKPVAHTVDFGYEWEIQVGSEWIKAPYFTVNPEIDVFTGWEGFTPEIGQYYTARCTVHEMGFGHIFFDTIYPAVPFVVQESPRPTIYTDIPDEVSFRNNGELNLKVDAGGDDLHYIWETNAVGSPYWAMYSEDGPSVTLSSIRPSWDGLKFRCRITNSEGGETVSNVCTLRYDDGAIRSVAFTTPRYRTYGEPYVPVGGTVLETDIRCETSGVEITGAEWDTLEEPDGITSTFYGQIPHLTLSVRFSAPVADEVSVTLDGVPFDYSPYGTDNGLFSGRPYMGAYAWIMHTARGEEDAEINTVSVTPQGATERGYAIPQLNKLRMGYRGEGDSYDVRYSIDRDETKWACDGEPVELYRDHFLGNANYRMEAILRAKEGWIFTSSTCVLMDGEKCETKLIDEKTLQISRDFYWTAEDDDDFENNDAKVGDSDKLGDSDSNVTDDENDTFSYESEGEKTLIALVTLDGSAPALSQTCADLTPGSMGYENEDSPDQRYSVKSTRWFCEGQEMTSGDFFGNMFFLGRGYEVVSILTPSSGYKFSSECEAKFGEQDMKAARLYDGDLEVRKSWFLSESNELIEDNESYSAAGVVHDQSEAGEYVFGTLTINCDYTAAHPAVLNREDGLVIYVEKDVTVTATGGASPLVLSGDTIITGPGRLTLVSDGTVPAIQVNGCKLTVRDTALRVTGGIRGTKNAALDILYSTVEAAGSGGAIYDFTGGMTLEDVAVAEPSFYNGSTLGFYEASGNNYSPVNAVSLYPRRAVRGVSIEGPSTISLEGGESIQLIAAVLPADAALQEVTWTSSNDRVKVSPDGTVTARRVGNATVTASCGGMRASVSIAVTSNDIDVESVRIVPGEITVGVGQSAPLRAVLTPSYASDLSGFWYTWSTDTAIATLENEYGTVADLTAEPVLVTGLSEGDASIILFSHGYADSVECTVHVVENFVPATAVSIAGEANRLLREGDTVTLAVSLAPANATRQTIIWSSSDPDVVSVDQNGTLTVCGVGDARITAEVWNGSEMLQSGVDISVPIPVSGLSISAPANVMELGNVLRMEACVYPGNAAERSVVWSSSDEAVAVVDERGVVTAVGLGSAEGAVTANVTVTCTTVDGGFTDEYRLTVNAPPRRVESITLSQYELTLPTGGSRRIDIDVAPWNADNKAWECRISGSLATTSVVTLADETAEACTVVAGDLPGTANLVFRTVDGGYSARLRVNVIEAEDYVPVESVTIPDTLLLGVGQSMSIETEIAPFNASNRVVLTDPAAPHDFIRVENGWVYGVSEGWDSFEVYVDGRMSNPCSVHVVKPVETLSLDEQSIEMSYGEARTLTPTVEPLDAYDRTVTWESADESIVTVDEFGTLHAVGFGTTYVTASNETFPLSASCSVTVVNNLYDLYINNTRVTDENSAALGYDPAAQTLTLSGSYTGGSAPLVRSEIVGLTVLYTDGTALAGANTLLDLAGDTTITGAGLLTLGSASAAPVRVRDGAALTLDGASLSVSGPAGLLADGFGESLTLRDSALAVSAMVEAVGGFNGGITLDGCAISGGIVTADAIENAEGRPAPEIDIIPTVPFTDAAFTLPSSTVTVESEAFEGIAATSVYIPDGCASIGDRAFANAPNLTALRVPAACTISPTAFENCSPIILHAPTNAPAETYCADKTHHCYFMPSP